MREVRLSDFTTTPGPRYRGQGPHSAEEFRKRHLEPAMAIAHQRGEKLCVDLAGTRYGCPIGFLEEAFGGLVRTLGAKRVIPVLEIVCKDYPATVEETERLMADTEMADTEKNANRVTGTNTPPRHSRPSNAGRPQPFP